MCAPFFISFRGSISAKAFGRTGLETIYCKGATPATLYGNTFSNYTAALYVPTGAKATYQAADYWKNFANIAEKDFDKGDITGDGLVDVSDLTTLVSMILDSSNATDVADINGDGSVDVSDLTRLVSIILGTDTANSAPAKAEE